MNKATRQRCLEIMGQIKQIIREMGRSVSELRDELDKVYEGELLPDGSMPPETADQFLQDFGKVHEALQHLREGHDSVVKAESAINGDDG